MGVERILLVNPNRWRPKVAPVALDYLSSSLEAEGFAVDVLDLCHSANPARDIALHFNAHSADLVGITHRNLDDIHYGRFMPPELRQIVRWIKDRTDAPIVLGGSGFSIYPERLLEHCDADFGIAGEGEFALPMLARSLGDETSYPGIPGLVYRPNGSFRRNPVGLADLSDIRFSQRRKIDYSCYVRKGGKKGGTGIQTKRGCSQDCIYCVIPNIEGRTVRVRPVPDVADEIEDLLAQGVSRLFFCDSEFNYPEDHARAVCQEIIARKLGSRITWYVYMAPKPFSLDLGKLMVEAGCRLAIFTVENANEKMLRCMRKDFTTDDIRQTARFGRESGLTFSYTTMFGGPGETMSTVLETLDLLREVKPTSAGLSEPPGLRIYPNTPLAEIVKEEGFHKRNPNLHGCIEGNEDFFRPVYYLSAQMGILVSAAKAWRKLGRLRQRIWP